MTRALTICLSLALVVLLVGEVASFISSWPLKPRCPFRPPRLKLKENKANRFRGSCRVLGWRRDTCKGSRMSCCKNVAGDYVCVRPEGVERRRQDLFYRIANPFEFDTPEILQLLGHGDDIGGAAEEDSQCPQVVSPLDCIYDQSSGPCQKQADCPQNSVCCTDHCYTGGPNVKLCFPVTKGNSPDGDSPENEPIDPSTEEILPLEGEDELAEQGQEELPPQDDAELTGPNSEEREAPEQDALVVPKGTDANEDSDGVPQDNKPTAVEEEANIPDEVVEQETNGNIEKEPSDEVEVGPPVPGDILKQDEPVVEQCPKPNVKCDPSGKCAVVCAGYSADVTPCKTTDDCQPNRVCCDDPCPNSELKLCFEKKRKGGVAVKANAKAAPPTPKDKKKPPKGNKKQNNDPVLSGRFVCPVGDFTSCIAWTEVPGRKGTGTCTEDSECEKGRLCCKITECNDGIKHCVPFYDTKEQEPGCPIPQYTAVHDKKPCSDGCKKSEICCDVDMQGTRACVNPV